MLKNIFLGAGPMSLEIVNSLNNFSKKYKKKIMLICSRNQIEAEELGGGYVNNFNTKTFSNFIQDKKNKNLILSRDHSGPYKRDGIKNNIYQEIEDCKKSLKEDIKNNFKILHIDTSMCGKKKYEVAEELINFCNKYALYLKKNIFFEFGCEEHGVLTSLRKFKQDVKFISKFKNKHFIVCQTGSLVKSIFQLGQFDMDNVIKMKKIADQNGLYLKEHNCDYLSNEQIKIRKKYGISAINVAPELGYIQSNLFFYKSKEYNLNKKLNTFFSYVLKRNKWKKWIYKDENDIIKFLSSAHYFFSSDPYYDLKDSLSKYINIQKTLDKLIFENVKRYYQN